MLFEEEDIEEAIMDEMETDSEFKRIYEQSKTKSISVNEYTDTYTHIYENIRNYFYIQINPHFTNSIVCYCCKKETSHFSASRKRLYCTTCIQ